VGNPQIDKDVEFFRTRGKKVVDEDVEFFRTTTKKPREPSVADIPPNPYLGKPREAMAAIASAIPFQSKIPGLGKFVKETIGDDPALQAASFVHQGIASFGAGLGVRSLIQGIPKVAKILTNSPKAIKLLTEAGINVTEGGVQEAVMSAMQGELPEAKSLAIFTTIDALLPGGGALADAFKNKALQKAVKAEIMPPKIKKVKIDESEVPIEPIKPKEVIKTFEAPKEAKPDDILTSARKVDMARDREALGLDELNTPERKSWEQNLTNAEEQGLSKKAMRIANEVNETPRSLSDDETAGLVIHATELKNEHRALTSGLGKIKDPAEIKIKSAEILRVEEEFDKLSLALRTSGTEKGRALAAQKLTINQDFDLISVKNRAKTAKEAPLNPKENEKFKQLTTELEQKNKRLLELEKKVKTRTAITEIKTSNARKYSKMSRADKDIELNSLKEQARKLIESGCQVR
jgi:predicted Fe-Mo cluster-binding NifX family protein